jgi:plastocyanin domain-containing protein
VTTANARVSITGQGFRIALVLLLAVIACKKDEAPLPVAAGDARTVALEVTEAGFVPAEVKVRKGEPLTLKVKRTTDKTCATEILIEGSDLNVALPLGQEVTVAYTPSRSGEIRFGCAMGMMVSGVLIVD